MAAMGLTLMSSNLIGVRFYPLNLAVLFGDVAFARCFRIKQFLTLRTVESVVGVAGRFLRPRVRKTKLGEGTHAAFDGAAIEQIDRSIHSENRSARIPGQSPDVSQICNLRSQTAVYPSALALVADRGRG